MSLENLFEGVHAIPNQEALKHPDLFNDAGVLQPMPAAFWEAQTREAKMIFGHKHGLYAFPTIELIEWLKQKLEGLNAIEIGAGNGAFCGALGIKGTDNYQQEIPRYRHLYELTGQPIIKYGAHVEKLDALAAVNKYKPDAVLACWVTHLFDHRRPELKGNEIGVDEGKLLNLVDNYFFVGNTNIHTKKPIFEDLALGRIKTHKVIDLVVDGKGLQSRASGGFNFVVHIQRIPNAK